MHALVTLAAALLLAAIDLAFVTWIAWPASHTPQHMAHRPAFDELEAAVSASKREVRRALAPWSHSPIRHDGTLEGDT